MKWLFNQGIWLAAFLSVVLLAGGCSLYGGPKGGESHGNSKKAPQESVEEQDPLPLKIGVSIYRYDDNFMKLYRLELKQYLEETYQAEVMMRNAGGEKQEQVRQLEQFIEEGCDGILLNPVDVSQAGSMAETCGKAGIPLVFMNRLPSEAEQNRLRENNVRVSCVGTDSRQAGTYQGEIILETPDKGDINGDGTISYVMLLGERGNEDSRYRAEYSIKALKAGGMKTEELFSAHGDWSRQKGRRFAKEALDTYGSRIEVIFCCNDAMANGALEAVEEAGRKNGTDIYLVGVDALEETVAHVKDGKIIGTVFNDHVGQSHTAADILVKLIRGEEVEVKYLVDYIKITTVSTFQK